MRAMRFFYAGVLFIFSMFAVPAAAGAQGNSDAAHACQQGGYLGLVGSDGTTFSNVGQCVSYAAHGGTYATGIIIPAGMTATFTQTLLSACNNLTYGYSASSGAGGDLGSKAYGCGNVPLSDQTVGPFDTAVILRVYLRDNHCGGATFYSDGGDGHAQVAENPPSYTVDMADAGGFCERMGSISGFNLPGNLHTVIVIGS